MAVQSDVGRLVRVAMKHPRDAFVSQATIDAQWKALGFVAAPDFHAACREYDALARLLEDTGTTIEWLPSDDTTSIDSIYVRDASLPTASGLILCRMGKPARAAEPEAQGSALAMRGLPVAGRIVPPGQVEGGDLTWLDERVLAVGLGYRTNQDGIDQLRRLLGDAIDEMLVAPLPHWRGPGDVMHLMSLLSPVAPDVAVVYSRLLTVPFRTKLLDRGLTLIEVPDEEFDSMGGNVLAVGPRQALMLRGNPLTRRALEGAGFEVLEYEGREISLAGSGGPTCLTRPLLRDP
jgi:N-dimethylarginine dimethylaminohydrolase